MGSNPSGNGLGKHARGGPSEPGVAREREALQVDAQNPRTPLRLNVQLADGQVAPFEFAGGDTNLGSRLRDFMSRYNLRDLFEEPLRLKIEAMAREGAPVEDKVDVVDLV